MAGFTNPARRLRRQVAGGDWSYRSNGKAEQRSRPTLADCQEKQLWQSNDDRVSTRMPGSEEKPNADLPSSLQRLRDKLRSAEGTGAFLTVTTLFCGFAFAGLVLYIGTDHPRPVHIVAASVLAAAFIVLLYAAICAAYLVAVSDGERKLYTRAVYQEESTVSLLLGLALLLGSVCVMSFAWSAPLGWVVVPLSAAFVLRFGWDQIRDVRLRRKDRAIQAGIVFIDAQQRAFGSDMKSFTDSIMERIERGKELIAKSTGTEGPPDKETVAELRALRADLADKINRAKRVMPEFKAAIDEGRAAFEAIEPKE